MSAQKRTQQTKAVWLELGKIPNPPASFREKVLAYRGAKAAFAKLTKAGLNEELVWQQLWKLAWLTDESKVHVDARHSLNGVELKTLRRFRDRVRGWAHEVESIGSKIQSDDAYGNVARALPLFLELQVRTQEKSELGTQKRATPDALARSILERRDELAKLAELPSLLGFYADYIDALCGLTTRYAPKAPARFEAMLQHALIEYATRVTRRPHYPEIVKLINAAYSAQGSSKILDAHNLSVQYSRHSRRKS
jgi:hypothetical protein